MDQQRSIGLKGSQPIAVDIPAILELSEPSYFINSFWPNICSDVWGQNAGMFGFQPSNGSNPVIYIPWQFGGIVPPAEDVTYGPDSGPLVSPNIIDGVWHHIKFEGQMIENDGSYYHWAMGLYEDLELILSETFLFPIGYPNTAQGNGVYNHDFESAWGIRLIGERQYIDNLSITADGVTTSHDFEDDTLGPFSVNTTFGDPWVVKTYAGHKAAYGSYNETYLYLDFADPASHVIMEMDALFPPA